MEYRRLGASGLKVSEICLGSWLTYGNAVDDATAEACVNAAFDAGINFFDTANVYANGRAEEVLGRILKKRRREEFVIGTKVYFPMGDGPNDRGLSRKHIREQCEQSLKRLQMDYVDLYQCHRFDTDTPLEETLAALDDLVTAGKVLYIGFSEWTAAQIAEALGIQKRNGFDRFVSSQPYYNLLGRAIEKEIMPLCWREGIGQIVYSPLAQGLLTGKYRPGAPPPPESRAMDPRQNVFLNRGKLDEELLARIEKVRPAAEREGLTMAQLALAWCLRREEVSSVIIGASKPAQVMENAAASGRKLSADTLALLEAV
ncbi:MAG: aldo/keto reductase family protein [Chthonomonadales bacterium]